MNIKRLDNLPLSCLVEAFNDAFSQYIVPVNVTGEGLAHMLKIRDVSFARSFGVFDDDQQLCAFVLNGFRTLNGQQVAYNAGTGVRISHQRKGYAAALLQSCIEHFKHTNISEYRLEVITTNAAAVKLYENTGFVPLRTVDCFKRQATDRFAKNAVAGQPITITPLTQKKLRQCAAIRHHQPTWQNDDVSMEHCVGKVQVIELHSTNSKTPEAYLLLDPISGSVHQIGFLRSSLQNALALFHSAASNSKSRKLSVTNLDSDDTLTQNLLEQANWEPTISQYEMVHRLK